LNIIIICLFVNVFFVVYVLRLYFGYLFLLEVARNTHTHTRTRFTQNFVTQLSNGVTVELKKNGKNIEVTYENRKEFASLVVSTRLQESSKQLDAMRKGLNAVFPIAVLMISPWQSLEKLCCGEVKVDLNILEHNTNSSVKASVKRMLFQVLRGFNNKQRQDFLRFVWGRTRLPLKTHWSQKFRLKPYNHSKPDTRLPKSHTCFFGLDMPSYSTTAIASAKLLYAVTHCRAIDTDGSASRSAWYVIIIITCVCLCVCFSFAMLTIIL